MIAVFFLDEMQSRAMLAATADLPVELKPPMTQKCPGAKPPVIDCSVGLKEIGILFSIWARSILFRISPAPGLRSSTGIVSSTVRIRFEASEITE